MPSASPSYPRTWAIYARQSLDRTGAGLAVERQIEDCLKLGSRLKLQGEPVIYTDNDISASRGKRRPEYERLLSAIETGQHSDLVVWHTDRLHRNNLELERFISVVSPRDLATHAVQAGLLDLRTTTGQMTARILGAVAQQEVEHKGERRRRAAMQKAERGQFNGSTRGFGYEQPAVQRTSGGGKQYVYRLNRREAAAIRAACAALLRGQSSTSVWKAWNDRSLLTPKGNPWDGTTFRNMIKRPALAGLATYKGEIVRGADGIPLKAAWPAVVPLDQWQAVVAVLNDPARKTSPGPTPKHLCGGVTFCECGAKMRSAVNSIKSKRTGERVNFPVYRCSSGRPGHVSIKMELLDDAVYKAVGEALWRTRAVPPHADSAAGDDRLVVLELRLAEVHVRETRLAEAIADGIVSREAALSTSQRIAADRQALVEERDAVTRQFTTSSGEAMAQFWEGIELDGPGLCDPLADEVEEVVEQGGRALIEAMAKQGMDAEQARGILAIEERFDALAVEQRRALVSSLLHVEVRRGSGAWRVVITQR